MILFVNVQIDNFFVVFKSINDIFYIIYTNKNKSIICYNLIKKWKINEIKYCHDNDDYAINFRHYLDRENKRDLVVSASCFDNNIKGWNANNWECILNLTKINKEGILLSSCFLNINNNIYVVTSSNFFGIIADPIKIFDFDGKK